MSLKKTESEIKEIYRPIEEVYMLYSDLSHFEKVKSALSDPSILEQLQKIKESHEEASELKLEEIKDKIKDVTFTSDTLNATTAVGTVTLRIVERESPKLVKLASEGSPIQFYLWIQLIPNGPNGCKLRVTVGAEVNMFTKMLISKHLKKAADGVAQMLAAFPNMANQGL